MARPATAAVRLLTGEREPVRLATTANIATVTVAGVARIMGLKTIDGVLTEVGDRVLVKDQTDASINGIYTASEGYWYRAADARTSRTMQKGTTVHVQLGTVNAGNIFEFTADEPVVGTDDITIAAYMPIDDAALEVVVQANVPIFASKASAAAATIGATVKKIELQFYAPSYAVLNTLVGRGSWSRMSKADIDSAGYPALAQWRSVDRIMPDGTTDATNGGYWVLNDDAPTPQMLGLIDDSGVLDQTAIFQAWVTLCGILGKPCVATVPAWIKITDTVTLPEQTDIDIEQLRITYTGTEDRSVLYVPAANTKTLTFGIVEGDTPDWTSDDYCGIYLQDVTGCDITLKLTRRFTVGYALIGDASTGSAYNRVWPGTIRDCKYNERLKSLTAGGFINENVFFGGNYGNTSAAAALGVSYGTHVTAGAGAYTGHNNNRWIAPNYEMGGAASVNRVPFFFEGAGGYNTVHDARAEACYGPLAIFNGSNVRFNEIGFSFASTSITGQLNTIQEVNGANSNRLIGSKYAPEVRAQFSNLRRLLSSNGGADGPYVGGNVFIMDSTSGLARRSTTLSGRVQSNALGLELSTAGAVMVAVDTSKIKQWRLSAGYAGDVVGSVLAIAFDASGARLTGDATDVTYGDEKYIKNVSGGWAATANFGGGYIASGFTDGMFSVRQEVQTMWIGLASSTVRSFELVGYCTSETLDNTSGVTSVVPFVPLDDDGSVRLASADPATAGTHGYYSKGQIVWNSGAASGQPSGWQCTTAGWLAAAWAISTAYTRIGRIVTNDTGKMYQLVTAGTSAGSGGPTGTGSAIADGTCVWNYVGVKAVFAALANLA